MPGAEQKDSHWTYTLHAETKTHSTDLVFTGLVPPWRPGGGKSYFGDLEHYFAWLPAIPYGTVEGTLTYDGQTRRVIGTGYHDHNWGNVPLPSVLDHWTWGRAHVSDYSLIFVEQVAARKFGLQRIPVFLLAKGDKILADDARLLTMQAREIFRQPGERAYPHSLDFLWSSGKPSVHLALRDPQLIESTSLLGLLPRFKRPLARLVANPYYFRFKAKLELTIDLADLQDMQHGTALYELMVLN
jgi:predicted secreted hydrolase